MVPYYFFMLLLFIYLHKYVYYWGEKMLLKIYYKENNISLFSEYKKKYIIKNIWKSAVLFFLLVISTFYFIEGFLYDKWYNVFFYIFGTLYTSLDISGLIYVKGLPLATKIHHVVVGILGSLNLLVDYNKSGYYRSILIYTYFSIVPFLVNFYLGYRYIYNDEKKLKLIAKLSYKIYLYSLILNILCQIVFFILQEFSLTMIIYIMLYSLILYDDIKLIKFLKKESL